MSSFLRILDIGVKRQIDARYDRKRLFWQPLQSDFGHKDRNGVFNFKFSKLCSVLPDESLRKEF